MLIPKQQKAEEPVLLTEASLTIEKPFWKLVYFGSPSEAGLSVDFLANPETPYNLIYF